MRTSRLIAVLMGLTVIAMVAADAQAVYHPTMGRFLQRDPGAGAGSPARMGAAGPAVGGGFIPRDPTGSNQYADGMNLYQYVRSNPQGYVDPSGLRVVIAKNDGGTANRVVKAFESLCPCFTYERGTDKDGNHEIKIKTWEGKDAKGKKKLFPYDPANEQAKKEFCKCYLPSKKTWEELKRITKQWWALSVNDRRKNEEKYRDLVSAIKGNRGRMASCTLVAQALNSNTVFRIRGKKSGISFIEGTAINWNYTNRGWITGPISLGHELVHGVHGIGGGDANEFRVVSYENAFRWEAGIPPRLDYGKGVSIVQHGGRMMTWPKIDRCECPLPK